MGAVAARRSGAVEKKALEGFQTGLSWITILRKRPRFREAFAGFEPVVAAAFSEDDVERLLADPGIVRNRSKIEATISNAAVVRDMAEGELDGLMWSYVPTPPPTSVRGRWPTWRR